MKGYDDIAKVSRTLIVMDVEHRERNRNESESENEREASEDRIGQR